MIDLRFTMFRGIAREFHSIVTAFAALFVITMSAKILEGARLLTTAGLWTALNASTYACKVVLKVLFINSTFVIGLRIVSCFLFRNLCCSVWKDAVGAITVEVLLRSVLKLLLCFRELDSWKRSIGGTRFRYLDMPFTSVSLIYRYQVDIVRARWSSLALFCYLSRHYLDNIFHCILFIIPRFLQETKPFLVELKGSKIYNLWAAIGSDAQTKLWMLGWIE